jgi:putative endopeptidase
MPRRTRRHRRHESERRKTRKPSRCELAVNFYGAQNDAWTTATAIPATETRITQAYFIRESINRELAHVLTAAEKEPGPVQDLLRSWDTAATSCHSHGIPDGLSPILLMLLSTASPSEVAAHIGWMNRHGIGAPIRVYVQGDPRDHSRCRVFLEEGQPRIGIPEFWLWPSYRHHRRAYATYVDRIASLLRLPALRQGYGAEREFANIYPSALERRTRTNMLTLRELQTTYSAIDWPVLLTATGLPADRLNDLLYNVTSRPFLHHLNRRFRTWRPSRWGAWFALSAAQWMAGLSPAGPLREAWFNYARRHQQGMPADDSPLELRRAIAYTLLPNTLGRLWVRDHCTPGLRHAISTMTEHIRNAAAEALRHTEWMAPATRRAAIAKLRAMDVQLCWPDPWPTEPAAGPGDLSPTNYVGNLLSIAERAAQRNLDQLTKPGGCRHPLDDDWGQAPYVVNAFYYPEENRFLLPAGILRAPFYDPDASLPANYGAIGATIGHEFCHAFDAEGRRYDGRGDTRDWWSDRDERDYLRRARRMVRLFESERYRGMRVDGTLTLTENIADLGGLEFALGGLRRALGRPATAAELREFFVSYAVSWRAKDRLKRAAQLLATDFHAPPLLRVNHIVRQFDEWYAAFDIGPECPGFVPPAKRIRFFSASA